MKILANPFNLSAQKVAAELDVQQLSGLTAAEVNKRQAQYGPNQLSSARKVSALKLIISQFKDVLILVLVVAATVSLGISLAEHEGFPTEAFLIYAIVAAIAAVGFFNEYKAEKTVEALRKLVSQTCRVRRDGQVVEIETRQLVPGDIVLLDEGKKVPADIRLLSANRLQANEASLTGESVPANKQTGVLEGKLALGDQTNMLFSGTLITTGTAEGVVVATGAATQIGAIARLVGEVEEEITPMQRKLNDLGRKLGLIVFAICALMFFVILFLGRLEETDLTQRIVLAFTAAVALAVAAIPEGLAFVVRISLALGARRMANKKALVRKLSAVESLGSTDVVCSDKTGTLTKGEMTVRKLFAGGKIYELGGTGYDTKGELTHDGATTGSNDDIAMLATVGALCNNARLRDGQVLGDPTEGALLVAAAKTGLKHDELTQKRPRLDEIPFSSERKMMSTLHEAANDFLTAVKGAPGVTLQLCTYERVDGQAVTLTEARKKELAAIADELAAEALRVLAFAYREDTAKPAEKDMERGLTFAGFQAMMDPPRKEVAEVIRRVQAEAGMRVIMITGDGAETAKAVAREIGISGGVMTGLELDALSDEAFAKKVEAIGVYARVNPSHKIRIVQALKHHGHQVAMTGDGVNDAPAIKAADIGIAMGTTGTDAAKEASDMILLDDKFVTIINAIEEGRSIFDNMRKFVNFLLSCNIAEVITVLLGVLLHGNLVLTAAQILFINIVTDGLPAIALGSDPAAKNIMTFKPRHYQQPIINRRVWIEIFVFGLLMSVALLVQYSLALAAEGAIIATSVVFLGMVVYEFARLLDIRSDYHMGWFSNKLLIVSMGASLLIQTAVIYLPTLAALFGVAAIGAWHWAVTIGVSVVLFGIMKLLNPVFDYFGPEYAPLKGK